MSLLLAIAQIFLCLNVQAGTVEPWPYGFFAKAAGVKDGMELTFPATGGRFLYKLDNGGPQVSNYGEKIFLKFGHRLEVFDRHSNLRFEPIEGRKAFLFRIKHQLPSGPVAQAEAIALLPGFTSVGKPPRFLPVSEIGKVRAGKLYWENHPGLPPPKLPLPGTPAQKAPGL